MGYRPCDNASSIDGSKSPTATARFFRRRCRTLRKRASCQRLEPFSESGGYCNILRWSAFCQRHEDFSGGCCKTVAHEKQDPIIDSSTSEPGPLVLLRLRIHSGLKCNTPSLIGRRHRWCCAAKYKVRALDRDVKALSWMWL